MSFDFSRWASQSLAKIEGTLDQAFGLDSGEPQQGQTTATPPSLPPLPSLFSHLQNSESTTEDKQLDDNVAANVPESHQTNSIQQELNGDIPTSERIKSGDVDNNDTAPKSSEDHESVLTSEENSKASQPSLTSLLEQRENQCKEQSQQLASLYAEKMDLEMKLSVANAAERELRTLINELTSKDSSPVHNELQRTKAQLQDLLSEGEQWSKKQMNLENVVKNLRKDINAKKSEVSGLQSDIESKMQSIQTLTNKCRLQEVSEKGLLERIAGLTGQFNEVKTELERLKRESVLQDKETIESVAVTERLEAKLKAQEIEAAHWKVAFDEQSELQARIAVMQDQLKEGELREETLRRNVIELSANVKCLKDGSDEERRQLRHQLQTAREQLDEALSHSEQLRREVPLATHPLLKQIETLQNSLKLQKEKSESTEAELLQKLAEAEKNLEKRRVSIQSFENSLNGVHRTNEELRSELDTVQKRNEELQSEINELREKTESLRDSLNLKEQHYDSLHQQLIKAQTDAQQFATKLRDEVSYAKANEFRLQKQLSETRSALSHVEMTLSQQTQEPRAEIRRLNDSAIRRQRSREILDSTIEIQDLSESKNSVFAYDMNTQLRRQEAELVSLRERLLEIENDRDALAEKLVEASIKNSSDSEATRNLQEQLDALKFRHDVALSIIGEKTDQVEELKADLKECKAIFKEQLEEMARQLQAARIKNK